MKLLIAFFAFFLTCSAADIRGKWNIVSPRRDGGETKMTMVLRQEGAGYSGFISSDRGEAVLSEIRVNESEMTFKVVTDDATYSVSASIDGDTMKGKYKVNDQEAGTFTATRDRASKPTT